MTFLFAVHFKTNEHLIFTWQTDVSLYLDVAEGVRKYKNKKKHRWNEKEMIVGSGGFCLRTKQSGERETS